ncbi:hypothetical protein IKW72_05845 [bacterium]|nr:hypothetical protein [bacterium]
MAKEKIISAIDLGTQTVRAAIGRLGENGSLEVIGYGTASSQGIIKSRIEDQTKAAEAIKQAVLAAENDVKSRMDYTIKGVIVSVGGAGITSDIETITVDNNNKGSIVTEKLLSEIDEKFEKRFTHKDKSPVHVYIKDYFIDSVRKRSIEDVLGSQGEKVSARGLGILQEKKELDKIAGVLNSSGQTVECYCFDAVADGWAILTPEQRQKGSLVINAGAGSTSFAFWKDGIVYETGNFPVGGDHVTNDLALGLGIPFNLAEEVKQNFSKDAPEIRVCGKLYKNRSVETIIQSRTEETVKYISDMIKEKGVLVQIQSGVFLTGNAARSTFNNYVRREFTSVEIKTPCPIVPKEPAADGDVKEIKLFSPHYGNKFQTDPGSSTVLGMLVYTAQEEAYSPKRKSNGLFNLFSLL